MAYFLNSTPDYARAVEDFNQAAELAPSPTVLVNRGRIFTAQQNYAAAMADFSQAIALEQNFAPAYYRRGIAYAEQSQFALAISDIDHAAELSPDNHAYQDGRCRSRILANVELNIARTACNEAIRLSPDPLSGLLLRGMIGIKEGRWQDARDDFDQVLRGDPDSASAVYGRGIATLGLGNVQEGQREVTRAREMRASVTVEFSEFGISPAAADQ